jgi:Arc/MetJ-type ribon-helix-helix transcriptional regulator
MPDTEKVSMNMSVVDVGQIDLLVDQGYYASRTDFLRTAIRNQLLAHADMVKQTVARSAMVLGVLHLSRAALEQRQAAGEHLDVKVVGLCSIDQEVPPDLALATIASLQVYGVFRASAAVKAALASRTT